MNKKLKETLQVIGAVLLLLVGLALFAELSSCGHDWENDFEWQEVVEEQEANEEWRAIRRAQGRSEISIFAEDYLLPFAIVVSIAAGGFGVLYLLGELLGKLRRVVFIGGELLLWLGRVSTFLCVGGTIGGGVCLNLDYEEGARFCFFT